MITPLQKQKDGVPYARPPEIEQALEALSKLPIEEVVRRAGSTDADDIEYVHSECILYFVRKSKQNGDTAPYSDLFVILRERVLRAVPVFDRRVRGLTNSGNSISQTEARELVLQKFQEFLCLDRAQYEERLDFYEIRFSAALAALRTTAQRSVSRREKYQEPMQYEGDSLALSTEVEEAIMRVKTENSALKEDFLYRSDVFAAIKSLPAAERQVVELILQGNKLVTIAKMLGCGEQTVRHRRDRAYMKIRNIVQPEDVT